MAISYPIIKDYIVTNIENKTYDCETRLPTEREFTEMFHVSRMTVRRAFDELIQDGFLIRKPGYGVFVAPEKTVKSFDKLSFKSDKELIKKYGEIQTIVLSLELIFDDPLCHRYLHDDIHQEVYLLKRIQYGGKRPLVYENIYFLKKYFQGIEDVDCTQAMSDIVEQINGKDFADMNHIEIEADVVNKKMSTLLQMNVGAPLLKVINIEKKDGDIIFFTIDSLPADMFKFAYERDK